MLWTICPKPPLCDVILSHFPWISNPYYYPFVFKWSVVDCFIPWSSSMRAKLVTVLCIALGALALVEGKSISKENGIVDLLIHFNAMKRSMRSYFLCFQPNSKLNQRRSWKKRNTRWPNLNPRMKRANQKTVGDLLLYLNTSKGLSALEPACKKYNKMTENTSKKLW